MQTGIITIGLVAALAILLLNTAVDARQTKAINTLTEATELLIEHALLADRQPDPCGLVVVYCAGEAVAAPEEPVSALITRMSLDAGLAPSTALRIANCESTFRPNAKNAHSSATGLYQFTVGTWNWIGAEAAGLDRTNPEHSTAMFLKWYPRYPGWWECS